MRRRKCLVVTFFVLVVAIKCTNNYVTETVEIQSIDTIGVHFSYMYLGEKYEATLPLNLIEEDFYSTDSIKIKIDKNNPVEFEFVSVVRRKWPKEEVFVPLDRSKGLVYNFHSVDKKPLFLGTKNEFETDSVLTQFLKKELFQAQDTIHGRVALYLIIDKQGKATVEDVLMADSKTEVNIRGVVANMPLFEPGEHKGEKVKVSYLVEIK